MYAKSKKINLCSFGHPDLQVSGVFDDSILSVAHLVRLCGATPIIRRNSIDPGSLNIVWGAGTHYSPPLDVLLQLCSKSNTIIFNMEQISSDSPLVTQEYIQFLANFRVFDYNIHNIRTLRKSYPLINAEEFPLLPTPVFCTDHGSVSMERNYDFAFYGAMNERRQYLLKKMQAIGLQIKLIAGIYGPNLSRELAECHAVLNIHAYETSIFETARALRPVAMGIPIVSEVSLMPQIIDWAHAPIRFVQYDDLVEYCAFIKHAGFSGVNAHARSKPEFIYRYHRNPELLNSVRYLLGID